MPSRATALLLAASGLSLACGLACDNAHPPNGDAGAGTPYAIRVSDDYVAVAPNGSRQLFFSLVDGQGRPVPNRVLVFQIADVNLARGATLSLDRGVTDARGSVGLQVIAGLATTFKLRVSAENANRVDVVILVDPRKHGPVEVAPQVLGGASESVATIRLFFAPGTLCARVSRASPPTDVFPMRTVTPGQVERYSAVSMDDGHAIVGQGLDAAGVVLVDGCVDLSGSAILEEGPVRVVLPLSVMPISPVGRFHVTSQLRLRQTPTAVKALADAWAEISLCATDPGRLWLDCTVDALNPETADDPLDCQPSKTDESAFGGRLAARRGLPPPGPPGGPPARCRGPTDAAGRASLEMQILAMFSPQSLPTMPNLRSDLVAISREAGGLFNAIGMQSTFEITATSRVDRFQLDHHLEALELGEAGIKVPVNLWSLGLPVLSARLVPAATVAADITFQQHGFTLRLGSAARLGLEQGVLGRRGYASDTATFIASIYAAASYVDRGTTFKGCPALAALVCPLVDATDGCLVDACQAGVAALGRRLAAAFAPLNGTGLDLFLEGTAPLIERDGDGRADSLGWLLPSSVPGFWSGQLRAGDEEHSLLGIFTADREL